MLGALLPPPPDDLQVGQKNDPAGTPVGPYGHGPAGLFNRRGIDELFSAVMVPMGGILDVLPAYNAGESSGNVFGGDDAAFDTLITGVTSGAGDSFSNQPTTDCADGPVGGLTKLCKIVNTFGRYRHGVREVSIVRAGRRADRCDPLALRVLNNPAMAGIFGVPGDAPSLEMAVANEWARRYWESTISARRMFSQRIWIGSPANNSGERRDITGFEYHINENNKYDADMQALCTAANSDIKSFGFDLVNGSGRDIVEYIEMCDSFVTFNAKRMGLWPATWAIALRPELWREIANVWPVRKHLEALREIARFPNGNVVVDANAATNERNAMLNTHLLPVNGRNLLAVEDDGIPEDNVTTQAALPAGRYGSDIFGIPLTVMGGVPVSYLEYFNHANAQSTAIQRLAGDLTFTSDGGQFRHYINFKNGCLNETYEHSPRLRVRTPQIGWRITDVAYQPLQHFRSTYPGDTYFANGGVNEGETQRYYSGWSPSEPAAI